MSNTEDGLLVSLQEQSTSKKMNADEEENDTIDSSFSTSVDIEADDVEENNNNNNNIDVTDERTCRKTSYPHVFQLYMFSSNLFSPGSFSISSSNKFYWERISEAHNISTDKLNSEIKELNRLVLWYMFIPKILWIIPWICLPIGVVIYAVEDGYKHNHPNASKHELNHHLFWSYNGLFIFVGGGIGGVLLATQLWNHCWYLCIKAMAKKINALNNNDLWLNKYCVTFDIQCDIPVLAGRSYGRAYYKVVITIHHEYLLNNNNKPIVRDTQTEEQPKIITLKQPQAVDDTFSTENTNNTNNTMDLFQSLQTSIRRRNETKQLNVNLGMGKEVPRTLSIGMGHITNTQQNKMNYLRPTMKYSNDSYIRDEIKEEKKEEINEEIKEELQIETGNKKSKKTKKKKHKKEKKEKGKKEIAASESALVDRATLRGDGIASSSLFNLGGFVSKSVLNDKSTRSILRDTRSSNKSDKTNKKLNINESLSNDIND